MKVLHAVLPVGSGFVLGLVLVGAAAAAGQVFSAGSQAVVEYNAFENAIKLSSKVDFANVRVTFDDTPGQYVTIAELRGWVKARPTLKSP